MAPAGPFTVTPPLLTVRVPLLVAVLLLVSVQMPVPILVTFSRPVGKGW